MLCIISMPFCIPNVSKITQNKVLNSKLNFGVIKMQLYGYKDEFFEEKEKNLVITLYKACFVLFIQLNHRYIDAQTK